MVRLCLMSRGENLTVCVNPYFRACVLSAAVRHVLSFIDLSPLPFLWHHSIMAETYAMIHHPFFKRQASERFGRGFVSPFGQIMI